MLISEIYRSRQGEGKLTGTDSVFIRTSGCNLRCSFCDTPFASWDPEGQQMSVAEIVARISDSGWSEVSHVVITGGEPMIVKELDQFTAELSRQGKHITIETAGTVARRVNCDLMSISPKLSNSTPEIERAGAWRDRHERDRINLSALLSLIRDYHYQLKFVVANPEDLDELLKLVEAIGVVDRQNVMLMPEGVDAGTLEQRRPWIEQACRQHGFTHCPRMHILWYGNKRGT